MAGFELVGPSAYHFTVREQNYTSSGGREYSDDMRQEYDNRDMRFWVDVGGKLRRIEVNQYAKDWEGVPLTFYVVFVYSEFGVPNEITPAFGPPTRIG